MCGRMKFTNPVIPGFYPDPSICRVGDDYYLVNSSFEFFPGVPVWHSKDLVHWVQVGNILTRESQLPLKGCRTSGGIFAPTLRWHDNKFYMVTTNVTNGGNFYVWSEHIEGPWSDPVFIDQKGIDPSLFWDDDGTVYFQSTHRDGNGKACIAQSVLDLPSGKRLSETKVIWYGTGGKAPEGPHMYKINGWYYLMIAEGGTEYGHMETIARSQCPWGPFEGCPHNPIVTHRQTQPYLCPFQGLGHADLTEDQNGRWWMVFHAIRPTQYMLHHIGRETMLAPVEWDKDGWPRVNGGNLILNPVEAGVLPASEDAELPAEWTDDFDSDVLAPCWNFLRNPERSHYSHTRHPGCITLMGSETRLDDTGSPAFVGVRQRSFCTVVEVQIPYLHVGADGCVGVTVFHTAQHHYDLTIRRSGDGYVSCLRKRVADILVESDPVPVSPEETISLRIESDRYEYRFLLKDKHGNDSLIGKGSTQLLSTEVMSAGTFTGCYFALFAEGDAEAAFDRVCIHNLKECENSI